MTTPLVRDVAPIPQERPVAQEPGDVDVWYCFHATLQDEALLARYDALLTEDERARGRRYLRPVDQHQHLVARALVRTSLSRYAAVAPEAWRFETGSHGKPAIAGPRSAPPIHFNLSHTHGLLACAVSLHHPLVGVDVEDTTRRTEPTAIASRFFSPREVSSLLALPVAAHRERFFSFWTLKESYIKARGLGLAIPLDSFSFDVDRLPHVGIDLHDEPAGEARAWRFALLRASNEHLLAVGARVGPHGPLRVRARRCVPLDASGWGALDPRPDP